MEENEMIEEMDVVANELLAVQGDVLTSNEAMKAEILANLNDLVKEVQDSNFDTQQSIEDLKKLLSEKAPGAERPVPPAPAQDGALAELKAKVEKLEKTSTVCAAAAVIAALAAFIGLFIH